MLSFFISFRCSIRIRSVNSFGSYGKWRAALKNTILQQIVNIFFSVEVAANEMRGGKLANQKFCFFTTRHKITSSNFLFQVLCFFFCDEQNERHQFLRKNQTIPKWEESRRSAKVVSWRERRVWEMWLDVGPNRWPMQNKWHERTEWNTVSHQIEKNSLVRVIWDKQTNWSK